MKYLTALDYYPAGVLDGPFVKFSTSGVLINVQDSRVSLPGDPTGHILSTEPQLPVCRGHLRVSSRVPPRAPSKSD